MQVGSYGFNLILTTKLDLTTTTTMSVVILRPDSTFVTKELTNTAFTEPPEGQTPAIWRVSVSIADGDLNSVGVYRIQLIDNTEGRSLPSAIGSFNVLENLQ